jgi:hypothetical protein
VHLLPSVTAANPVASSFPYGPAAQVRVRVAGSGALPTGTVTATAGATVLARASLVSGAATLAVPTRGLGVGTHTVTISYSGDAAYDTSADTVVLRVVKGRSSTTVGARPVRAPARATTVVRVLPATTGTGPATGTVRVEVRRGTRLVWARTVRLGESALAVRLPRLGAGRYAVRATYSGSSVLAASSAATTLVVRSAR